MIKKLSAVKFQNKLAGVPTPKFTKLKKLDFLDKIQKNESIMQTLVFYTTASARFAQT